MAGFPPVPKNAIPTGPTGLLDSGRKGVKSPGKRTMGGRKGISGSQMNKPMGKR
jgi:hypothetical protein